MTWQLYVWVVGAAVSAAALLVKAEAVALWSIGTSMMAFGAFEAGRTHES